MRFQIAVLTLYFSISHMMFRIMKELVGDMTRQCPEMSPSPSDVINVKIRLYKKTQLLRMCYVLIIVDMRVQTIKTYRMNSSIKGWGIK